MWTRARRRTLNCSGTNLISETQKINDNSPTGQVSTNLGPMTPPLLKFSSCPFKLRVENSSMDSSAKKEDNDNSQKLWEYLRKFGTYFVLPFVSGAMSWLGSFAVSTAWKKIRDRNHH